MTATVLSDLWPTLAILGGIGLSCLIAMAITLYAAARIDAQEHSGAERDSHGE